MNVYFNAEYTGFNKHAQLISLGFTTDNNESLYIEFKDVSSYMMDYIIKQEVLPNTYAYAEYSNTNELVEEIKRHEHDYDFTYLLCDSCSAAEAITTWFSSIRKDDNDLIQLVSYCSNYDMTLLLNLFDTKIPPYLNLVCVDIAQDVAMKLYSSSESEAMRLVYTTDIYQLYLKLNPKQDVLYPKDNSLKYAKMICQMAHLV